MSSIVEPVLSHKSRQRREEQFTEINSHTIGNSTEGLTAGADQNNFKAREMFKIHVRNLSTNPVSRQ